MDRALAGQRRYLAAYAAAAAASPVVCRHQLAALARERALVDAAAGVAAYRAASGDLVELSRALWIDRVVGHARSAAALDDPWAVAALRLELDATLAAGGHDELGARLIAASTAAAPLRAAGGAAVSAYARLVWAVVQARSEARPHERAAALAEAVAARRRLRALDPGFDPRALAPRYRWRTPWTGTGLAALAGWIDQLDGGAAGPGEPQAPADEVAAPPDGAVELAALEAAAARWIGELSARGGGAVGPEVTVADVVAPYAALAGMAGDGPEQVAIRAAAAAMVAAAAGQPTPQDVQAVWLEQGLQVELARAPIQAGLVRVRQRLARWPEPLRAHHVRAVAAALSACRTNTEVDLVSVHGDACLAVEADWNRALAAGLLAPLRATFVAGWDPSPDARRAIPAAWAVAHALAGAGSGEPTPWLAGFVRDVVVRHAATPPGELGAEQGEVGADLIGEARPAIAIARAGGELAALEPGALWAWLAARWGTPPAPVPGAVRLWDDEVELADLGALLDAPARPTCTPAVGS